MDVLDVNASARPKRRIPAKSRTCPAEAPVAGVVHDNFRHNRNFTIVGNHLAQHPRLSALSIGLALYIQSLPVGSLIDIKTLAARFSEGATRIAAALRELEDEGYLRRQHERLPSGRIVTRTVSCNNPDAARLRDREDACPDAKPDADIHADTNADTNADAHADTKADAHADTKADPAPQPTVRTRTHDAARRRTHGARPAPSPEARPHSVPAQPEKPTAPRPLPPVPQPGYQGPGLLEAAHGILADLHRYEPSLLLSADEAAHLAPGGAAWLERDVSPTAIRKALAKDLPPEGVRHPAAFLAHRLTARLPPIPRLGLVQPHEPAPELHPLQTCEGCDRAFRAPEPGRCRDCRAPGHSYGEDVTVADWTISTTGLPRHRSEETQEQDT